MKITVRPARPSDANLIVENNARLAEESEAKMLDRERLRAGVVGLLNDSSRGRYLIAEREDHPVGQLMLTTEWSDWRCGWFWWIQSVYVLAEARRCGVYRALHAEAERLARAAGDVIGLRLYVELENHAAQETYRRLGMIETRYRMYETDWNGGAS